MERPFIVHVNLSSILKDRKETQYIMYIDYTKMTVVYELLSWIQWIFSLTHCVYLTHENSMIHELEDIKILYSLKKVKVHNCDHSPCAHGKLNHLLRKLNYFVHWDGMEVPHFFLHKVNEITKNLIRRKSNAEVMMTGCSEEEREYFDEIESNKLKELGSGNISTCENQLSENLNNNMCGSNKKNFNIKSNIKLDDAEVEMDNTNVNLGDVEVDMDNTNVNLGDAEVKVDNTNIKLRNVELEMNNTNVKLGNAEVKMDNTNIKLGGTEVGMGNSNNVHSVVSNENEFVITPTEISKAEIEKIKALKDIIPTTTNFNMNSDVKLYDTTVQTSSSNKAHSVFSNNYDFANVNSISKSNTMGSDTKLYDTAVPYGGNEPIHTVGMNNSNKTHSAGNEFTNAPIKISKAEIEKIKALKDIKISESTECNEYEEINKSNRKRLQSLADDKKFNGNKIIKKGFKPFSVGEILTSLRSGCSSSSNGHEFNTFSTQQNENHSNGLNNEGLDQNYVNYFNMPESKMKIKRKRIRRHRPRRLCSGGFQLDNFSHLSKHEEDIPGTGNLYAPYHTKRSTHIRFPSDDEDYSVSNRPEPDKQSEKTQHDLGNSNEPVENGMQQFSSINEKEETLSMTQMDDCNKNDESKVNDLSEANKEYSTLDKLILLHDKKSTLQSSTDSLFEYSNEDNQETVCVPKTPDNYDFNLSTLKALKEKFPSPMVVERFY